IGGDLHPAKLADGRMLRRGGIIPITTFGIRLGGGGDARHQQQRQNQRTRTKNKDGRAPDRQAESFHGGTYRLSFVYDIDSYYYIPDLPPTITAPPREHI